MPGKARGRRSNSQIAASQQVVPSSQRNGVEPIAVDEETIVETQDDIAPSQAASQAKKVLANISPDVINKKVSDLVQYLLIMEQKKYPIKRLEINKVVLKEHSKAFVLFMEKAKKVLNDVFGLKLVETEGSQKSYILINALEQDKEMPLGLSNEEKAKTGLVMAILSVIFMKGNVMQDDELYHFLGKLGIDVHYNHVVFGDMKKFLTVELVRQGYLDFQKQRNTEPVRYEVRWGPRAKLEVSKMKVLQFVCQLYEQQDPTIWTDQFKDAEESQE